MVILTVFCNHFEDVCYISHILCAVGVVKKQTGSFLRIVHEKFRSKNAEDEMRSQKKQMDDILKVNPELKDHRINGTV